VCVIPEHTPYMSGQFTVLPTPTAVLGAGAPPAAGVAVAAGPAAAANARLKSGGVSQQGVSRPEFMTHRLAGDSGILAPRRAG
jgi:hypothetical protein